MLKSNVTIKKLLTKVKHNSRNKDNEKDISTEDFQPFSTSLDENEKFIKDIFGDSKDLMITKLSLHIQDGRRLKAMLVAIDGIIDEEAKRNNVLKPLQQAKLEKMPNQDLLEVQEKISTKRIVNVDNVHKAVSDIVKAHVLLLIDGYTHGLTLLLEGYEVRAITEPETEQAVLGSREGFIEAIGVNTALLRRRISHPSLRFDKMTIGKFSETDVTIVYMNDIADPDMVQRVKDRLKQIKMDAINSSGEIEQLIEDHPYSIFPTVGNTERPDKAAFHLLEGRVIILVDGNPVSLVVPYLFLEGFKNIEDYNSRPYYSSLIRLLRFFAFIFSITLPALYISALNFNKALIPSDMIITLIQARETVPFPLAMEVIMMIIMFEVVREAGVRLPEQIGTAISIVGPLILGDVAVSTGLVGAPTVVIVSLSYIAAFIVTPLADVTALLRLVFFIASSIFGSYGLCMVLLGLLTHMVSLTSLGVPYMAPFSPFHFRDWKDAFVRFPTKFLKHRPKSIPNQRSKRIELLPDTGKKQ